MNAPLAANSMTPEEFLIWESAQPERHDCYQGEVFAMAGGNDAHNTAIGNVFSAVRQHPKGSPCRVFMSDMRLELAQGRHCVCPDVFVTCDARDKAAEASHTKQYPIFLVVEVLSPSTSDYDRGAKFDSYRDAPSLKEVLFIDTARKTAELYRRSTAPEWVLIPAKMGKSLKLQSLDMQLHTIDIFDNID